jgi:uncharacterized damage-inducible protein DinB
MKKLPLLLALVSLALPGLRAAPLTAAERTTAAAYLGKTRAAVVATAADLSDAQLQFKAAPDRWSVAEVLEHIASAEDFLMGLIEGQVMKAPARGEGEDVKAIDEFVLKAIPDRSQKVQAPEPLKPSNRFGSTKESLKHFDASRAKTVAFLNDHADLREHAIDSPLGKKLDAYQWVLFIGAHSERHTKQMQEVKDDPKFPKR